ncbi:MAG: D-phenylhydantoinase [Anaerolineales bacterium]|nr:D-phenylhydantoinase [Anaerolineales bacterium]
MALIVKNGMLVTEAGSVPADLRIEGETVQALGAGLPTRPGDEVIDAEGCYVMPGMIDPHVHFQLRVGDYLTVDDFAAGTRSAACGGVTTIIDFVSDHVEESLLKGLDVRQGEMKGQLHIDAGLHMSVVDLSQGQDAELAEVAERGVTSIKMYTTYRQAGLYGDDDTWYRTLARAKELGMIVVVHAENDAIVEATKARFVAGGKSGLRYHPASRPGLAELEVINRGLFLAREAGNAPIYFVHMSVGQSPSLVAAARMRGQPAIGEACTHHLLLNDEDYAQEPERYFMTPPLRPPADQAALWDALERGRVDTIATDHCAYPQERRIEDNDFRTASPGVPGVETRLMLMYTSAVEQGHISVNRLVQLLSTNPARVFGLYPRKGALTPGADADVVIYDPRETWTLTDDDLHSNAGFTPYAGMTIQGRVRTTTSRGRIVWHEGEFRGDLSHGRFVKRERFDPAMVQML